MTQCTGDYWQTRVRMSILLERLIHKKCALIACQTGSAEQGTKNTLTSDINYCIVRVEHTCRGEWVVILGKPSVLLFVVVAIVRL